MPALVLLNKPDFLPAQAVDFLTNGWDGGLLDLSEMMIVLPTQEARRRLHEGLVRRAASRKAALLPPVWMLPMQLTEGGMSRLAPASLEQVLWLQVIAEMTPEKGRQLFPRKVPRLDPVTASTFADSVRKLRGELAQAGMSLHEAADAMAEDQRWRALYSLEKRYLQRVAEEGFIDRIAAQLDGAKNPILPHGVNKLLIAAVPDLPKVYEQMIPRIEAQGVTVTILVFDPGNFGAGFFDQFGRPGTRWRTTPIPLEKRSIHLCLDPAEEAGKSARLAQASRDSGSVCSIGITSTELARPLLDALKTQGMTGFDPAGQTLDSLPIGRLLKLLTDQQREDDFPSTLQLLRHSSIQAWLGLEPVHALSTLDALASHFIPASLDDLLARWPKEEIQGISIAASPKPSLHILHETLSRLHAGQGAAPLLETLRTICGSSDLSLISGGRESVERIREWVLAAEKIVDSMSSTDVAILLWNHLRTGICMGEKAASSIELPGWLELLWEDAPHLIIAGMNDGLVPEIRREDSFVHEKTRQAWGLASDASRLCRDSYLLLSLKAARMNNKGRLDLLLVRQNEQGEILKPSRLLMRPEQEEDLPLIVRELFRELPPRQSEQWQSAWALKPERKSPPRSLSASAIRDYLACPTRFYLKHLLKLQEQSFGNEEADAAAFGTLLHDTLREFGNTPRLRNLRHVEEIEAALISLWKEQFESHYGTAPAFPLLYQREAGIRRLRGAAVAQAALRSEGWEIVACERTFEAFPIGQTGMMLRGQIDRIDRRETASGIEWRIIDYKSSEQEKSPAKDHYQSLGKNDDSESLPPHERFELEGKVKNKAKRWINLQLPMYRMILLSDLRNEDSDFLKLGSDSSDANEEAVEVGYFILPANTGKTGFIPFPEAIDLEQSFLTCLEGVVTAIREGVFWPPRRTKYDDFENLFFGHLESDASSGQQTIDPEHLIKGGAA